MFDFILKTFRIIRGVGLGVIALLAGLVFLKVFLDRLFSIIKRDKPDSGPSPRPLKK